MHFKEAATGCVRGAREVKRLQKGKRGDKWWKEKIKSLNQKNSKPYERFLQKGEYMKRGVGGGYQETSDKERCL